MAATPHDDPVSPPHVGQLKSERVGAQLSGAELAERLRALPGWRAIDGQKALQRSYEFPSFRAAIAFVCYVAELAEAADHYPEVSIARSEVALTLTTRSTDGLTVTDNDLRLAASIHG